MTDGRDGHDWSLVREDGDGLFTLPVWRCSKCGARRLRAKVTEPPPSVDAILKVEKCASGLGRVVEVMRRRGRAKGYVYVTCLEHVVEQVSDL